MGEMISQGKHMQSQINFSIQWSFWNQKWSQNKHKFPSNRTGAINYDCNDGIPAGARNNSKQF